MPFLPTDSNAKKVFKGLLVASAFGSMLFPIFMTLLAAFLLPWQGFVCVLALDVALAAIPLRDVPPPKFIQRYMYEATQAAIQWMSIKVVYKKEDFEASGPYVLGMCAAAKVCM
jgi:hypothetical protein